MWRPPRLHIYDTVPFRRQMPAKKPAVRRARPRPVHFETTIPVIRPCIRCGVWFAAGVAEGVKAEVELTALDQGQSVWAVLNRIELYCIRRTGLVHMDALRMSGRYLGRLYPQHQCDLKWPIVTGVVHRPPRDVAPPY